MAADRAERVAYLKPLALLAVAFLVSACTRVDTGLSSGRRPWTQPDVLRIALPLEPKTLNPLLASSTVDVFVGRLLFEPLISADARGNPVPILVKTVPSQQNGGISKDGLTVTYHLRPGIRWSDGIALTSEDVKWSWSAIMRPANNVVSRHGYDVIAFIRTPDPLTVVVRLQNRYAPFVNTFFAESDQPYAIVPAHALRKYADINRIGFNQSPAVSDGPFRLERWAHGDRISMTANDSFFLGRPHLKRIDLRIIPDENAGINLLRTHAIDYMYQPSISNFQSLSAVPNIRIVLVNMNGFEGMELNTSRRPLSDPRVLEAVAASIDKEQLVRTLTFGQERIATEDIPDWMWAADRTMKVRQHNIGYAKKLLRAAGVAPGTKLLLITDTASVTHRRAALEVQSMLAQAGLDVELKYYLPDVLYAPAAAGGVLHAGKFDLVI
ncbi:MAG: peptide ABC transporter substrate-binding protein, partial [Candidatus Eremiobacteraeota bacterium]|nr:peptide ABC transporter substrate-binding protein [Candidatus Eremiobacteraeota bacterium]